MNNNSKILLNTPELRKENQLLSLVENQTKFNLNNCEFSIYETHKAAFNVKLHFENIAFTAMLRGKKHMKLDNKTNYFDYYPGESILVAPGETMVIDFPEADETPTQCISLSLNPDFIEDSLNYLNYHLPKVDETSQWNIQLDEYFLFNNKSLASATNNIMRIAMDDNSQKDIMADFALKELLIRLMQTQARGMVEKNIVKNKSRIGFVVDYIKRNLHQKLSIDSIAKLAYVSKSNFFKMFKDELGTSPNDFILQERITRAKELLASQTSIKETAFQTGFSDTNYFTRVFKQLEGVTPKSYQDRMVMR
ncbi:MULTISPECIES: AraC family transcriptional regulator [Chryseobacterium]|uniref:AraC family transcriptional regulator n=1 Tax=Chryseobacterium cucumeris TaxID=1813611 RepID=A0ABX9X6E9_9FLAO|nr:MULTISPECIES: AraC family transcriptional regulator [Chryseobacterium]ROH90480.1 AraC family transcriptional regulator [Chryseobacterium cucumeris]TXI88247.1 MAG: AraC family transcriptional regulator [Chryseobacterium sp.]WFB69557.1 AraC family transcriptional regulator [Chryseobacterium sp. WX]WNI38530.1 AraC family transcriptional regulator [Chryseobacterium sp. SG20098]